MVDQWILGNSDTSLSNPLCPAFASILVVKLYDFSNLVICLWFDSINTCKVKKITVIE